MKRLGVLVAGALLAATCLHFARASVFRPGSGGGGISGAAGGDLGGTYPNPTVRSVTNVASGTLSQARGGTGAGALTCAGGQHLTSNGTVYSCSADTGGVSSVGMTVPAEMTVSGSPVTTSGTLGVAWGTDSGAKVIATPAGGGSGAYAGRALVAGDISSGVLGAANGGTGATSLSDLSVVSNALQVASLTHALQARRIGVVFPTATNGTTASAWGLQALTVLGAAGAASPFATRNAVAFPTSAATTNSTGGLAGPFTETRPGYQNKLTVYTVIASSTDNGVQARQWWGLASASLAALAPVSTPTASGIHFAAVGYDTAFGSRYQFCTGDGANYSCTDLGVSNPTTNTYVRVTLDWTTQATPTATIDQATFDTGTYSNVVATTSKSSNVTASTTVNLGLNLTVTTLANVFKNMYLSKAILEQN